MSSTSAFLLPVIYDTMQSRCKLQEKQGQLLKDGKDVSEKAVSFNVL